MAVADELPCGGDGRGETRAENQVVEAAFEQFDQFVACGTTVPLGIGDGAAQLALGQPVVVAQFLLFHELQAEFGFARGDLARAVLTRRLVAFLHRFA